MAENIVTNIKKLMVDLSLYTGALILGPLIIFGVSGYLLDSYFQTKPLILVISFLLAIIFSNIFIFRKIKDINQTIKKQAETIRKENKTNET